MAMNALHEECQRALDDNVKAAREQEDNIVHCHTKMDKEYALFKMNEERLLMELDAQNPLCAPPNSPQSAVSTSATASAASPDSPVRGSPSSDLDSTVSTTAPNTPVPTGRGVRGVL